MEQELLYDEQYLEAHNTDKEVVKQSIKKEINGQEYWTATFILEDDNNDNMELEWNFSMDVPFPQVGQRMLLAGKVIQITGIQGIGAEDGCVYIFCEDCLEEDGYYLKDLF